MLPTHEPDPERDRHPARGAGSPDGAAQTRAELVGGSALRDRAALGGELVHDAGPVVLLDSAVLFAIQAVLHDTISILVPMATMLIQTAAGIAFLHVQARRCAAELT